MDDEERRLVIDLDGSLLKADSLYELAVHAIRKNPKNLFGLFHGLSQGKVALKTYVGRWASEVLPSLPVNKDVSRLINEARQDGRDIILATASGLEVGMEAERHFGPFAEVIATDSATNLKGKNKATALIERFGRGGFDYVGDNSADVEVFRHSHVSFLVNPSRRLINRVKSVSTDVRVIGQGRGFLEPLWRLMRPHQWTKNLLLVVPALGAQEFSAQLAINLLLGFIALSAVASALYIANDLLDIRDDRRHPEKQFRPLAAGDVSIRLAALLLVLLLIIGSALGGFLGMAFLLILMVYGGVSATYSFWLKRIALVDVFVLAGLYGIRVIGGAVLAGLSLSLWLLSFSFFIFLSLALIKRFVEITQNLSEDQESLNGRDYRQSDRELVVSSGVGTGAVSAMLLALYIEDRGSALSGPNGDLLWLTVPLLLFWILRIWFLALRGRVASDPVLFALRDRVSLVVGFIFVILFTLVSF